MQRSSLFIVLFVTAAVLLTSTLCNCSSVSLATPSGSQPALTNAAGSNYSINISGEVIGEGDYLITADFIAELTNNRTDLQLFSEPFGHGRFQVTVVIPRDAIENDTFHVRVLSPDKVIVYGESNVTLNNTSPDKNFLVEIIVVNPPPNNNGIIIIALVVIFAFILVVYIVFVRWLIGRMVMKRASEIMIEKQTGRKGGEI